MMTDKEMETVELIKMGKVSKKSFLFGTPIKVATSRQVSMAYSMMMYMMGSLAMVTKEMTEKFQEDVASYPALYRQKVKLFTRKAVDCGDRLEAAFLTMAEIDDLGGSWVAITGRIIRSMEMDVMKLYFAIDNEVNKGVREEWHTVITNLAMAHKLSWMLKETADAFGMFMHNEVGIGDAVKLSQSLTIPIKGLYSYLTSVSEVLVTSDMTFSLDTLAIENGFKILQQKTMDWNLVSKACKEQSRLSGINVGPQDLDEGEDPVTFDNRGKAWNSIQDRIVVLGYGRLSDDELAEQLGRTKEAVRARARKLGVKKQKKLNERK